MLIILGVVLLIVAADRLGAYAMSVWVSGRAHLADGLDSRPDISIRGFPFLSQLLSGRYGDVRVILRDVSHSRPRIAELRTDLRGVRVPLVDAVRGAVTSIPVEVVNAQARVTFVDVNASLESRNIVTRMRADGPAAVRLVAPVSFLGVTSTLSGAAQIRVTEDAVTFTPRAVERTAGGLLPDGLRKVAIGLLTVRVPVAGLPFNLHLRSVAVRPDGLEFIADGRDVVLDRPSAAANR